MISSAQKQHLRDEGYIHIPDVIPKDLIKNALRAINSSMGQHLDFYDYKIWEPEELCPGLNADPRILDLFNKTNATGIAESALGTGKVVRSKNVQVALNFPITDEESYPLNPHVDGFHPSNDGTPGSIRPFTAIAGIFLSDVTEDWSGNFTVWPGSHRLLEQYYKNNSPDPETKLGMPNIELPEPVHLKVKAGDMIFAHYQLAHTACENRSEAIRYAVYFRMNHVDQGKEDLETLSNIWKFWEGMKELK